MPFTQTVERQLNRSHVLMVRHDREVVRRVDKGSHSSNNETETAPLKGILSQS
jgi:hypothetical protein